MPYLSLSCAFLILAALAKHPHTTRKQELTNLPPPFPHPALCAVLEHLHMQGLTSDHPFPGLFSVSKVKIVEDWGDGQGIVSFETDEHYFVAEYQTS